MIIIWRSNPKNIDLTLLIRSVFLIIISKKSFILNNKKALSCESALSFILQSFIYLDYNYSAEVVGTVTVVVPIDANEICTPQII